MNRVESLLERPRLYYNIDGVGELGIGFMLLGFALLQWLQLHTPQDSIWHQIHTVIIYGAVISAIIHYGSKAIKNRITYRRTGFVDYRPRDKYWVPLAIGAGSSALLSAGLYLAVRRHWEMPTAAFLMGLMFAATYVPFARTVRWKWAIFSAVAASVVVIAALPADLLEALANHTSLALAIPAKVAGAIWLTFVVYGALLMISGSISFWIYLRHTQAPAQESQ